ncbi:hypothetical protein CBS147339_5685 [Penicillium roqueforti]|uniref:F-box domain, cyclin-like n=1 Tax=Penicillium roqueforti (strain FM164) TaxID=1365484 RepID=W6QWT7_PENRF|nr:hypothetical protein DTO012A8_3596 [Penicillium roqueforti]KAI3075134.1 hypothetical protein CBS147339_5685 [Penicillium roqueforti]KAI3104429.1 hypothetical protein CBS147338_1626 [Penicillium roqueforti]KAI3184509.1 hypothetical protein DTO032C6_5852 [Penicillium roqueforti]CDM33992.1 F-box domain, cyclin-like [Penicillium roqueforti FM164]
MPPSVSFSHLPVEVIYLIVDLLEPARYLNSLAQTCSRLYLLLTPMLYQNSTRSSHGFPIVWAAQHSSEGTIRQAFDAGASTYSCHYNFQQSLVAAVNNNHETIVRLILEQNEDPSIFTEKQSCKLCKGQKSEAAASKVLNPLYAAAVRGNVAIVRLLLAYKITFEHGCGERTPICSDIVFAAVNSGHLAVMQVLIEAGYAWDDKRRRYQDKTPLTVAVNQGDARMVEYLLDKGAKPSRDDKPLLESAAENGHLETVKLLLERGAEPQGSALSCAAGNGHVEVVEVLLDHGADPDPDMVRDCLSTLYYVAVSGQLQILDLLLARGVNIYPKDPKEKRYLLSSIIEDELWRSVERQKRSAFAVSFRALADFENMIDHGDDLAQAEILYIAIGYGWDDIVQRVLEQSFSADGIYQHCKLRYNRPILQAIQNGDIGITRLLVEHGANIQEYQGESKDEGALSLAIQLGNVKIAELLIDHGADVNCISSRGETALAEATALASEDIFRMLLDRGADPKIPLLSGRQSLIVTAPYSPATDSRINATAILDMLLAHGADIDERRLPSITPLYRVILDVNSGNQQVRLLLERGADPFAVHACYRALVTEASDDNFNSILRVKRSMPSPDTWRPKKTFIFVPNMSELKDDPFLACMRRGDKAMLEAMLDAIDRKGLPLEELKDRLDRARMEATESGNLHLLPILQDYYWVKNIHASS